MATLRVPASYLGGDPSVVARSGSDGVLSVSDSGVVEYDARWLEGVNFKSKRLVMLLPDELRATLLDADPRFEVLAAALRTSGATETFYPARLKVRAQRNGEPFDCSFALFTPDGHAIVDAIQAVRASCGEAPLPSLDDIDGPLALLVDIRDQLARQTELIARLVAALEAPPTT